MREWPEHVLIFAILGVALMVSYAKDIALWVAPDRFLYDCDLLTAEQKVIVRNNGLPAIGIWKKCRQNYENGEDAVPNYGVKH